MASQQVREWFREQMVAFNVAHPPPDPLAAPFVETVNVPVTSQGHGDVWTTLLFPPSTMERVSIGMPGCVRESGIVQVTTIAKSGVGDAAVLAVAEALRLFFANQYAVLGPVRWLWSRDPMPPNTGEDAEGYWYLATIDVPFWHDSYQ